MRPNLLICSGKIDTVRMVTIVGANSACPIVKGLLTLKETTQNN
jgi:hypothetical protein